MSLAFVLALATIAVAKPARKKPTGPPPLVSTYVLHASGKVKKPAPVIMGRGTMTFTATITLQHTGTSAAGEYEGTIVVDEEVKSSQLDDAYSGTYTAKHTAKNVKIVLAKRDTGWFAGEKDTVHFNTTGSGMAMGRKGKPVEIPNQQIPPKLVYVTAGFVATADNKPSRARAAVGISAFQPDDKIDFGEFPGTLARVGR